jgi:hypothetical protein
MGRFGIMASHTIEKVALLNKQITEAKNGLLSSGLGCIGFLTLGSIITGITYSMASPGGTYIATTGLFLGGALSGVVAIWRLVQLLFYLAKRGSNYEVYTPGHQKVDSERTWKDLD